MVEVKVGDYMAKQNQKMWYESKTLWLNGLGLALVVVEYLGKINVVDPMMLATVLGVLNFLLRLATNEGVEKKLM